MSKTRNLSDLLDANGDVKSGALDNENTTNAEWELISINSIPEGIDKMPIGPVTMMRNQLNLNGGTKAFYSSSEWANSVRFYQQYAILEPNNKLS